MKDITKEPITELESQKASLKTVIDQNEFINAPVKNETLRKFQNICRELQRRKEQADGKQHA